jgi:putative lipoprotein
VVGYVIVAAPAELPEGAVVTVQLQDTSLQDVAATVIGEQIIQGVVSFPIPYQVIYPVSVIEDNHTYSMSVRITDADGNLLFINTSAHLVITNDNPSVVDVTVDPV